MKTKLWGNTREVFRNDTVEVHRIEAVRGGYCSMHKHACKSNQFFVESGQLLVTTFTREMSHLDAKLLGPGDSFTVPSGVIHQFEAIEHSVAYEIYAVESTISPTDIIRYSTGGIHGGEACVK